MASRIWQSACEKGTSVRSDLTRLGKSASDSQSSSTQNPVACSSYTFSVQSASKPVERVRPTFLVKYVEHYVTDGPSIWIVVFSKIIYCNILGSANPLRVQRHIVVFSKIKKLFEAISSSLRYMLPLKLFFLCFDLSNNRKCIIIKSNYQ